MSLCPHWPVPRIPRFIKASRPSQFIVSEGHNIWQITERLFAARDHHSSLCLKATIFERSQRGYLLPETITVHCVWRPQYLRDHREAICCQRPSQFIVSEGHNIWVITERLFAAREHHSSLCLKSTLFERSQRGYLLPETITVHCVWRPHYVGVWWTVLVL